MNGTNAAVNLASTFAVMNRDFKIDSLKVHAPTTMFFVTPGEGTENRESPE